MSRPLVVIVTGPPGAGKTVLGKRLSGELKLPFINKDEFKEILFDKLGRDNRQWFEPLEAASLEMLFHVLESQLRAAKSVIVETAFIPQDHTARFVDLQDQYNFETVQILCDTDEDTLFRRFIERVESGERHPGHANHLTSYRQFTTFVRERGYGALDVGGLILEVDTTDLDAVDIEGLIGAIKKRAGRL